MTDADCEKFINVIGKGWVYEVNGDILGFAILDISDKNIWALFVHHDHDKKGIGRGLHDTMLHWYFEKYEEPLSLGTAPKTQAEKFYRCKGWKETGKHGKGEIKFVMAKGDWFS